MTARSSNTRRGSCRAGMPATGRPAARGRYLRAALLASAWLAATAGFARDPADRAGGHNEAPFSIAYRFPISPALTAKLKRARQAADAGDPATAAELLVSVMREPRGFMHEVRPSVAIPVALQVEHMLRGACRAALPRFRELAEPDAALALDAAAPYDDVALAAVANTYLLTASGTRAALRCAALNADRGRPASAAYWWRRLLDTHPDPPVPREQLALRLAVAARREGRRETLDALVRAHPAIARHPFLSAAVPADPPISATVTGAVWSASMEPAGLTARRADPEQLLGMPPTRCWRVLWQTTHDCRPLLKARLRRHSEDLETRSTMLQGRLAAGQRLRQWLSGALTAADGSTLFYRWGNTLYALDIDSGRERWSLPGAPIFKTAEPSIHDLHLNQLLHQERLQHALFCTPAALYQIEDTRRAPRAGAAASRLPASLSAVDPRSGTRLWTFGGDPASGGNGVDCRSAPLVVGDTVYVLGLDNDHAGLYALDTGDGRTRWTCPIAFDCTHTWEDPAWLACDGQSMLFASTPDGLLHGIDRASGLRRWTASWLQGDALKALRRTHDAPVALGRVRRKRLRDARRPHCPFFLGGPHLLSARGGNVVTMPADVPAVACFNAEDGTLRRLLFLDRAAACIGVAPDGDLLLETGEHVLRVDVAAFAIQWKTPVCATGLGTVAGTTVYVPCYDTIERINLADGALLEPRRVLGYEHEPLGNLQALGPYLLSRGADTVALLENTARPIAERRARIAAGATFEDLAESAALLHEAGFNAAACTHASRAVKLACNAAQTNRARERLLCALAPLAPDPAAAPLLTEAAALAVSARDRARVALARADRAAADTRWTAAASNLVAAALLPVRDLIEDAHLGHRALPVCGVQARLAAWRERAGETLMNALDAAAPAPADTETAARLARALADTPAGWRAARAVSEAYASRGDRTAAELALRPWTRSRGNDLAVDAWRALAALYERQGQPHLQAFAAAAAAAGEAARRTPDDAAYALAARVRAATQQAAQSVPRPPWKVLWSHRLPKGYSVAGLPLLLDVTRPGASADRDLLIQSTGRSVTRFDLLDAADGGVRRTLHVSPLHRQRSTGGRHVTDRWSLPSSGDFAPLATAHQELAGADFAQGTLRWKTDGGTMAVTALADLVAEWRCRRMAHKDHGLFLIDSVSVRDPVSGRRLWERPLRPFNKLKAAAGDNVLLVPPPRGADTAVRLLDARTGQEKDILNPLPDLDNVVFVSGPVLVAQPGRRMLQRALTQQARRRRVHTELRAVHLRQGRELWRRTWEDQVADAYFQRTANLVLMILRPTGARLKGPAGAGPYRLLAVDPLTGETLAESELDNDEVIAGIETSADGRVLEYVSRRDPRRIKDQSGRFRYRRIDIPSARVTASFDIRPSQPPTSWLMEVVGPLAINPGGTFLVMFDLDARGAPLLRCYDKRSGAQLHEFPLSRMLRGRGAPPAVIKAYTGLAAGDRFILAAGEYVLALVSTDPPPDR